MNVCITSECVLLKPVIDRIWDQHSVSDAGKRNVLLWLAKRKSEPVFEDINANILPSVEIKQGFVGLADTQAGRNSAFCLSHMHKSISVQHHAPSLDKCSRKHMTRLSNDTFICFITCVSNTCGLGLLIVQSV